MTDIVDPSLVYNITYLGGDFKDFTVNFSRGSSMILLQYYNFLRFGRAGYQNIINNCISNANTFLNNITASDVLGDLFQNISDVTHLPIIVLTWKGESNKPQWTLSDLSDELRIFGWIVPAYVLPKNSPEEILTPKQGQPVLRIVVQQKVSLDKLNQLQANMEDAVGTLNDNSGKKTTRPQFKGNKC